MDFLLITFLRASNIYIQLLPCMDVLRYNKVISKFTCPDPNYGSSPQIQFSSDGPYLSEWHHQFSYFTSPEFRSQSFFLISQDWSKPVYYISYQSPKSTHSSHSLPAPYSIWGLCKKKKSINLLRSIALFKKTNERTYHVHGWES